MRELATFLGGLMVGVAISILFLSGLAIQVATGYPLFFITGIAIMMFLGGMLLGRKSAPRVHEMRLTGRVFDFPQGSVMVEVALRRARSIIPVRVTQE